MTRVIAIDSATERMEAAAQLREYADMVESGRIDNLAIVAIVTRDDTYDIHTFYTHLTKPLPFVLLGAVEYLKSRLIGNLG